MPALDETEEQLGKLVAGGGTISDSEVLKIIESTDDAKAFLNFGDYNEDTFRSFLTLIVGQLNNKSLHEHTKTRLLLVLNNCAMYKSCRDQLFNAIKYIDVNMETSMKVEGTMPFDSELGRMSEHMLVLLCRVRNYKVRAVEVLEFAEGNVQFAVQLLLAILLKEPPYEFELRVNCMTAMLGFSHPSTFFSMDENDAIQERALSDFEDKVNHICKLTKRLLVVRVVAQAISSPYLSQYGPVTPVVHVACMSMMKFITNVYNYATQQATSFRQHIITSTAWVDKVVLPYICKLIHQVAETFEMHNQKINAGEGFNPLQPPPKPTDDLPKEVLQGLVCSLRFLTLVTFHMGSYGRSIRFINTFTYDLLRLPLNDFISRNLNIYGALLQFNVNIDSCAGEDRLPQAEHLPYECSSESLTECIKTMLGALSLKDLQKLQGSFLRATDAMLARDVGSYGVIEDLLATAIANKEKGVDTGGAVGNGGGHNEEYRLLGDLPDPSKAQPRELENATGAEVEAAAVITPDDVLVRPKGNKMQDLVAAEDGMPAKFRCALNGHIMKNPVQSPHGQYFEHESIQNWLNQAGSTCPVTGKPLSASDLVVAHELASEITSWHIKAQAKTNQEDDFDVYEF